MLETVHDFDAPGSLDAQTIAGINAQLGVEATFVSRVVRSAGSAPAAASCFETPGSYALEARMLMGADADLVSILTAVECLPGAP